MNKGKHHAVMEGKGGGVMKGWIGLGCVGLGLVGVGEVLSRRNRGEGGKEGYWCC